MGQQKPREKPNKPKKTILNGLTQDSSHRIGFFVFFGFPRVFGQLDLEQQKPKTSRKTKQTKKNNPEWTYPRFFSQDCFFVSFWFSLTFWTYGKVEMKKGKNMEKQKMQKPNAPSVPFCSRNALHYSAHVACYHLDRCKLNFEPAHLAKRMETTFFKQKTG